MRGVRRRGLRQRTGAAYLENSGVGRAIPIARGDRYISRSSSSKVQLFLQVTQTMIECGKLARYR
eukprot:3259803-Pyramimonas_sp.AAC.1